MKDISRHYEELYGGAYDKAEQDERWASLVEKHKALFKKSEEEIALFSAAGRVELAGNHTDHNLGMVIAGTINLDTIAAVSSRDDMRAIIDSEGFPVVDVDLSNLECQEEEKNTTNALLRGIASSFVAKGLKIGGFQANTTTKVLKGSGLSSSATIEVLIGEIFNNLYNDDVLTPVELAKAGQYAENNYFGKLSGLMDQIGCANGGVVGIDFKDSQEPVLTPIDINFKKYGYNLVVVDTKGSHADLSDQYSAIPVEMRKVAACFGKQNLREVDFIDFMDHLPEVRAKVKNDRAILRAYHYFNENLRVREMLECLKQEDIEAWFYFVGDSGNSSFKYLQNVYAPTKTEEQGISLALAVAERLLEGEGASRVQGGGFAGTIQAYVPDEMLEEFIEEMDRIFGAGAAIIIAIRKKPVCRVD